MKVIRLNRNTKYVKQGIQNHKEFDEVINKSNEIQLGKKIICRDEIGLFKLYTSLNIKLIILLCHCDIILNKSND